MNVFLFDSPLREHPQKEDTPLCEQSLLPLESSKKIIPEARKARSAPLSKLHQENSARLPVCFGFAMSPGSIADGQNPLLVGRWVIPLFIGFHPSQLGQDSVHPQYGLQGQIQEKGGPQASKRELSTSGPASQQLSLRL